MSGINRRVIQQMFSREVFLRGEKYFLDNRVQNIGYNRMDQSWFAEVSGSFTYFVEIGLRNIHKKKISTFCDCPAFETYSTCKHIVATLLELLERGIYLGEEQPDAGSFIERILSMQGPVQSNHIEKIPMIVDYNLKLDYRREIYLEFKTGIEHRYIVRNVRDLLEHVLYDQPYTFTKKFTYDPSLHYFLKQDLELFQEIYRFMEMADFYNNHSYYGEDAFKKREVPIPTTNFSDILERLHARKAVIESNFGTYKNFNIIYDQIPYSYEVISDKEKRIKLQVFIEKEFEYFREYNAIFCDGIFYLPTDQQISIFNEMHRQGLLDHPLTITPEQKDVFFSEVLPVLKNVSAISIDETVSKEIVEYPLQAKLYVQQNEEAIIGKLVYRYGPHEINPFSTVEQTDQIIIRDITKEKEIMGLIEQSNFHYNGKELYIKLENDEEVYDFLYTILPQLNEKVDLFLTDQMKRLIVEREPYPSTNVSVQGDTNLLEISFDISGVDEEEIEGILQAVVEKKRFYRLQSGALLPLENEEFHSMQRMLDELSIKKGDIVDGKFSLPVYKGMQVDELIEMDRRYDPTFRKLLHRLKSPEEQVYELPEKLEATLRSYQETGFQWFKSLSEYHLGGILADDMGLGKTVQTIAYLLSEPSDLPHLIVVPSSVLYNWRNECKRFAPDLTVSLIAGKREERGELITLASNSNVWITSYGTLRQDIELYRDLRFQTLILDEAQYIKNYATKTSKAIREINALKKFALSGTPIENSLNELWAIFQVILPGFLPNQRNFNQLETEKISQLTRPFILRRLKGDVLKELPEKIESVHVSELTIEQKELYLGYLEKLQKEASASIQSNQFQQNRMKILAGLTRLRQLCCHPGLFIENYHGRSGKLDELLETIQTSIANGKRMLIFSQFTSMHELIKDELDTLGISYFYLHGQTHAKDRVEMSEAFNAGEKDVFLISLRAGGTGLNLTGADTVILFDLWWNPAVEDQAAGRAHRFGQKNVVQVIRFIAEGTIEEKIYELQQKKRELIDQVIQPGETMLQSLSEEDVRALLSI